PETLEDSLARLFGGWSVGSPGAGPPRHRGSEVVDHGAAEAIAGTGPPLQTASLSYGQAATEQVVLMMGVVALPLGHPDMPALRLLQCHLGVGMSARLFTTLREARGLAYDVGVYFPSRLAGAPFSCHMSSGTERAGEAVSALWEEWQRLLDQPLTGKELGLAKAKLAGQEAMGQMTTAQVSDRIALLTAIRSKHSTPWSGSRVRTVWPLRGAISAIHASPRWDLGRRSGVCGNTGTETDLPWTPGWPDPPQPPPLSRAQQEGPAPRRSAERGRCHGENAPPAGRWPAVPARCPAHRQERDPEGAASALDRPI
ncbi:MAG: insulinase family protein, partial [Aphanocapsa feldmannii 277cI]